jgi:hypothetical protein
MIAKFLAIFIFVASAAYGTVEFLVDDEENKIRTRMTEFENIFADVGIRNMGHSTWEVSSDESYLEGIESARDRRKAKDSRKHLASSLNGKKTRRCYAFLKHSEAEKNKIFFSGIKQVLKKKGIDCILNPSTPTGPNLSFCGIPVKDIRPDTFQGDDASYYKNHLQEAETPLLKYIWDTYGPTRNNTLHGMNFEIYMSLDSCFQCQRLLQIFSNAYHVTFQVFTHEKA